MPSFLDLPQPVLDRLTYILDPEPDTSKILGTRLRPGSYLHSAPREIVALSSTCKKAREMLAPTVFECVMITTKHGVGKREKSELEWLAEKGEKVLEQVRVVAYGDFEPSAIQLADQCLRRMVNLKCYTHCTPSPLSPVFSASLATLSHLEVFHDIFGGVESLPRLLPLGDRLKNVNINAEIVSPRFATDWVTCPVTVAAERRKKLPRNERNVATVGEQAEATVEYLAQLLHAMKDHVEVISVFGSDIYRDNAGKGDAWATEWLKHLFERLRKLNGGDEYPVFPELEGVFLAGCNIRCKGFAHLLETSPKIKELEITEVEKTAMPPPPHPLKKLEYLYVLPDDFTPVSAFIRSISHGAPLKHLAINGLMHAQIPEVFERPFQHLRRLDLDCAGQAPATTRHFNLIARRCPLLQQLHLVGGYWSCEATDIFNALRPLRYLRSFTFDHPWEAPRNFPFPQPDGRTIRTNRHQDFRVISIKRAGMTIGEEMKRGIREDIDVVLPTYHKRFAKVAKAHPFLRVVEWIATSEVTWTWTFVRDGDLDEGKLKRMRHDPVIDVGGEGPPTEHAGVFMTMPVDGGNRRRR
ncbi:hypothetical protein JCM8097_008064 [Rhodosporidiobolus ruineniae]